MDGEEMTLDEYINRLPKDHTARDEYIKLIWVNKKILQENRKLRKDLKDAKRKWWQKKYPGLSFWKNIFWQSCGH